MIRGINDFSPIFRRKKSSGSERRKCLLLMDTVIMFQWRQSRFGRKGLQEMRTFIMFGHTHRPYFEERDGITVLNPGSLSFPRQEGRKSSYMILETDGEEKYEFVQHFL